MILHKHDKVLRNYGIGSIAIVILYVLISIIMLVSGVREAIDHDREYEINFNREFYSTRDESFDFGDGYPESGYSSFIKIYYNENDPKYEVTIVGVGDRITYLPEYYSPDMENWTSIFSMLYVFWMLYSAVTAIYILGKRMFGHVILLQVMAMTVWLFSGDLVLLSMRGFLIFLPLMIFNIYVLRFTRFRDYKEHWFKGIFTYQEPVRLY